MPFTKPRDTNNSPENGLYQAGNTTLVLPQAGTVNTDANNNSQTYAPQALNIADRTTTTQFAGVDTFGALFTRLAAGYTPTIVQKQKNVSTDSVASLAKAFDSAVTAGNTIVVLAGCGNGTAMTMADSLSNTYYSAINTANSTTFEAAIWYAPVLTSGTCTVTATNAGTTASMAIEIYEVSGLLAVASNQPDGPGVGSTGTGTTGSTPTLIPSVPNGIAFLAVGVGTAAQAVSATTGTFWTLDSTQNSAGTPAGLFTFGALSQKLGGLPLVLPKATIASSEPWAASAAVFRPISLAVQGSFISGGWNYTRMTTQTTTLVKTGAGILHAIIINKPLGSGTVEADDALTNTTPIMALITLPATLLQDGPKQATYDIAFQTGLSVTTGGANQDVTIVWK